MDQLKKYIVLQLFGLFAVSQIVNCQWDKVILNHTTKSLSSGTLECFINDIGDKFTYASNEMAKTKGNTNNNESMELEEELDDCYPFKSCNNRIFCCFIKTNYSISYIEQYTAQFRPEIIPPPPKA